MLSKLTKEYAMSIKRRSSITYKTGEELITDTVWINNLQPEDINGNTVLLKLFRDEDGEAVTTPSQEGALQYQCSLPIKDGAFAYVPVNAMKALISMKRVRKLNDEEWVQLVLDPIQPSLSSFNKAETVTGL